MSKLNIWKIIVIAFMLSGFSTFVFSQNIYYSTIQLNEYIDGSTNKFLTIPSNCYTPAFASQNKICTEFENYINILKNYYPELKNHSGKDFIDSLKGPSNFYNPFLNDLLTTTSTAAGAGSFATGFELLENTTSSLTGLNITTIADGAAQFLIERANQELTIAFFDRFRKKFDKSIELQTFFPITNDYVSTLEPLQYASMLNALKEAFQEDFNNATVNFNQLIETERYQSKIESTNNTNIYFGIAGVQIINQLKHDENIPAVIEGLGDNQNIEKASPTAANVFKVISLISKSVRDSSDRYYVPYKDFKKNILENPIPLKIYLGLLYEQSKDVQLHIQGKDKPVPLSDILKKVSEEVNLRESEFVFKIESTIQSYNKIDHLVQGIKNSSRTTVAYSDYAKVIEEALFSLRTTFKVFQRLEIEESGDIIVITKDYDWEKVDSFLLFLGKLNRTVKAIDQENYASVALNLVILLEEFFDFSVTQKRAELDMLISIVNNVNDCEAGIRSLKNKLNNSDSFDQSLINEVDGIAEQDCKAIISRLKKYYNLKYFDQLSSLIDSKIINELRVYGAFIANIAQANSPEEVKAAIETAVLPVGSYRIKREAKFTIGINSYVGAAIYNQNFVRIDSSTGTNLENNNDKINSYGLNAPIGLEFSLSSSNPFCLPVYHCKLWKVPIGISIKSISLFLPLVDLGSVVNFRTNPEGNENIDLPPITVDNILATGAYIVIGINKAPISFGAGFQKGPQLREIGTAEDNSYSVLAERDWGFGVFLSVDIPLFNLKITPR